MLIDFHRFEWVGAELVSVSTIQMLGFICSQIHYYRFKLIQPYPKTKKRQFLTWDKIEPQHRPERP